MCSNSMLRIEPPLKNLRIFINIKKKTVCERKRESKVSNNNDSIKKTTKTETTTNNSDAKKIELIYEA